ncbi:HD domain-containing protein [Deinococcus sp. Arct2-2]|nr:HD domain-containing protein [Deinococcus sp. Arct2-2]
MLRTVASGGEQLLLSAPHPLLSLPLTSALLTPIQSSGRTTGVLALLDTREGASPAPETPGLLALLAQRVSSAAERYVALRTLAHTREQAFRVLGTVLEYRSYETKGHTDRVTEWALKLGLHLDLDFTQLTHLRWGAYLHDLGKIAIPDAVLLKTGPLTARERELMHQHVTIGEQMLREQEFVPPEVLGVVRHHHERWDGRGYPDGLAQHEIPMLARLFAVVDVYDALTSERPYKKSWTQHDALFEMRRMAGTHLDPDILEQFEGVLRSMDDSSAPIETTESGT